MSDWEPKPVENPSGIESDLPPEYCRYKDEGCELADSCLNCPFPQCIYDEPRGRQRWLKKLRDREIVRLFSSGGKRVKELAVMFGLNQRTIQRALRSSLSALPSRPYQGEEGHDSSERLHSMASLSLSLPSPLNKAENAVAARTLNKGDLPRNE